MLITGEFPPARGGVGDYTNKLSNALQEQGIGTKVFTKSESRNQSSERNSPALRVRRITLKTTLAALKGSRARLAHIQYQTGAYEMRPTANLLPLLLKPRWGRPTVVTFHDLLVPYLFPKAGPVREWINRVMARSAGAVIATNEGDAARLEEWGVRRLELIPIGSNIENDPPGGFNRDRWRAERGVEPGTILLAYFGFLNSTKGLDTLLRTVAGLERYHPNRYRLIMVGGGLGSSDPTNRATAGALDELARELGVAERLIWTGYLEPQEVSAALLSADIAVLPFADGATFRRGSLLAVLEHGLPLITTIAEQDTTGRGPRLVDGENALLVRIGDEEALMSAIERLAQDDALREKLARGSAALARHFSWEAIAEQHARLYDDLTSHG
jgi:glycosyltransferase involved in cell wall biosynthesis